MARVGIDILSTNVKIMYKEKVFVRENEGWYEEEDMYTS